MEIWEIAAILGHNDLPAENEAPGRPRADGPDAFNVRRMLAEQHAREAGVDISEVDLPPQGEVLDLIRRGKAG